MCVVSMIADDWTKRRGGDFSHWSNPGFMPPNFMPYGPSKAEFDALKAELEELKKQLEVGKQQDIDNGEPDCEMEEKIQLFRDLGAIFGVDFDEVLKNVS